MEKQDIWGGLRVMVELEERPMQQEQESFCTDRLKPILIWLKKIFK